MTFALRDIWTSVLQPILSRPRRLQVAALCLRDAADGPDGTPTREVLLVTSRGTGRWLLPKGWPMTDKTCSESALQEAWEEAGVKTATIAPEAMGSFVAQKQLKNGTIEPIDTLVFLTDVTELSDDYPEAHERRRQWVPVQKAAELVVEPGLKRILSAL